jgi:hypothetical protein
MTTTLLQQALDALEWLLANIRRDAPQLSGKAMGNAEAACNAIRAHLAWPDPSGKVLTLADSLADLAGTERPAQPTDEQIDEIASDLFYKDIAPNDTARVLREQWLKSIARPLARAVLAAQPKPKPVAWAMPRPDGLVLDVITPEEHESYEGEYTEALYAAQPAPVPQCSPTLTECPRCKNDIKQCPMLAAPVPVPLTDAQIEKLRENTFSINNPHCPVDSKSMRKAVRAAERAHGIGIAASPEKKP